MDVSVIKEQWEDNLIVDHPKAKLLNGILKMKLAQAEEMILNLSMSGKLKKLSQAELVYFLQTNDTELPPKKEYSLKEHFEKYISNCKAKGTADMYRVTLGRILKYQKNIRIEDINYSWLKDYESHLLKTCGVNTIAIDMRNIRAVFNDAINRDLVPLNSYPFRKFKIRKEKKFDLVLTIDQLKQFRDYPVEPHQVKYQDLFMLGFYLIGINTVDLVHLKHSDYTNGRIKYIRAKTGRKYDIEVLPEASKIIKKYKGLDYLLDVMDNYTNYKDFSSRFNSNLKEIGEYKKVGKKGKVELVPLFPDLIIYTARRTWATIAAGLDIPKETISAALGHGGNDVTSNYIRFDLKKVDKANKDALKAIL